MTQIPPPLPSPLPPHESLSYAEADDRLGGALSASFEGSHYETVLFYPGDVTVEGGFGPLLAAATAGGCQLIAVAGDLTVGGTIELYDEEDPSLYVGGFTRAETLEGGTPEIRIGAGRITHLVYGYYNHGILRAGPIDTPWVVNADHDLEVTAPGATFVDNFGRDRTAHFTRATIADNFVPEVVDDEYGSLVVDTFLERLRAGRPVLRPGHDNGRS